MTRYELNERLFYEERLSSKIFTSSSIRILDALALYNIEKYPWHKIVAHVESEILELEEAITSGDISSILFETFDLSHVTRMCEKYDQTKSDPVIDKAWNHISLAIDHLAMITLATKPQVQSAIDNWGYRKFAVRFMMHREYDDQMAAWPRVKARYKAFVQPSSSEFAALSLPFAELCARSFLNILTERGLL